ncbi:hypothetical protein HanXRQr2_Chr15g0683091 [Helianthus annuus]|uniref:Uncharacterized protein n=1 Tax=Helianthus annuus TaxID=4232 RepID=A0A9K3DYL3_HELAN|nr:hypothetical protein HanXRQr2_Chr15g0683091 [Helianthus annuus]
MDSSDRSTFLLSSLIHRGTEINRLVKVKHWVSRRPRCDGLLYDFFRKT